MNQTLIRTSLQLLISNINDYLMAYCIPVEVILTVINNALVVLLLTKNRPLKSKLGKTVRLYYIAFALGDTNTVLASHLSYFLGMLRISFKLIKIKINLIKNHKENDVQTS